MWNHGRIIKTFVFPIALLSAICVFLPGLAGCGSSNVDACNIYVKSVNQERSKCQQSELNPSVECPASLDHGGADCTDYYACHMHVYSCEDNVLVEDQARLSECPDSCR